LEIKKSNEKGRLNKKEPEKKRGENVDIHRLTNHHHHNKKSATPSFPSNPTKRTFSPFKIVSIVKNKRNNVSRKKEV